MKTIIFVRYSLALCLLGIFSNLFSQTNTFTGVGAGSSITSGTFNTGTGNNALFSNTTGTNNTATGYAALLNNTTGIWNTAMGSGSLRNNTTGEFNTAIGGFTLNANISGNFNTAVGDDALRSNTIGSDNTAMGDDALRSNSTGIENTALGSESLSSNSTGDGNTAVGFQSLNSNVTGDANIAVGSAALASNISGFENVVTGYNAMLNNTSGSRNTALGMSALLSNTTGTNNTATGAYALENAVNSNNTATGYFCLRLNTSGTRNTASGVNALRANLSGSNNVAYGYSAGSENDIYNNCTFIGYDADQAVNAFSNYTNSTVLGYSTRMTASNQVRIGNSSITSIGGQVNWTTLSDGRYKNNLKEDVPGLNFILKLRPVTYDLNIAGVARHLGEEQHETAMNEDADAAQQPDHLTTESPEAKTQVRYTGFVAQEVEKTATAIGYDFSGVDKPQNEHGLYGLRYAEFVPSLVKSAQEQQQLIIEQSEKIEQLEARLSSLEKLLAQLEGKISQNETPRTSCCSGARLDQNQPNPFSTVTTIQYYVPEGAKNAALGIEGVDGRSVKIIPIETGKEGQTTVDTYGLPAGIYSYSLMIDGLMIESKKMVLIK